MIIPKNWKSKKISDLFHSYSGGTPSTKVSEYWEEGNISWLRSGELQDDVINHSEKLITKKGLDESSAKLWPKNSVLIALTGANTGNTGLLNFESSGNQSVVGILPSKEIIPKFLLYYLQFSYDYFWSKAKGGAQPHINGTVVSQREIIYPKIEVQEQIVTKLEFIFKKLKNMEQFLLEQESLIKKNKLKDNLKNSILQTVRNGFYQKNKWSDYKKNSLKNITKITAGGTPSRNNLSYWNGKIPWIKSGELDDDITIDSKEYISEEGMKKSSAKLFPENTVLIALYGQGKTRGKTTRLLKKATTNQACCGIFPSSDLNPIYLQYWLRSLYDELRRVTRTGPQPNWNAEMIKNIEITIPPMEIQNKIVDEINKKFEEIRKLESLINSAIEAKKNVLGYFPKMKKQVLNEAFSGRLVN